MDACGHVWTRVKKPTRLQHGPNRDPVILIDAIPSPPFACSNWTRGHPASPLLWAAHSPAARTQLVQVHCFFKCQYNTLAALCSQHSDPVARYFGLQRPAALTYTSPTCVSQVPSPQPWPSFPPSCLPSPAPLGLVAGHVGRHNQHPTTQVFTTPPPVTRCSTRTRWPHHLPSQLLWRRLPARTQHVQ